MIRKLFACLGAVMMFSALATAEDFAPVGGSGDRQDTDRCPASYMKGVTYRAGLWLDQIRVVCATIDGNSTTGKLKKPFSSRGGQGGSPGQAICPDRQIVFGIGFTLTKNNQVQTVALYCSDFDGKQHTQMDFGAPPKSSWTIQSCGPMGNMQAGKGLTINSGRHVNALGMLCGRLPEKASAAPIVTTKNNSEADQKSATMICIEHATQMVSLYKELKSLGCESSSFDQSSDYWMKKCMKAQSTALQVNQPMLEQRVAKCRSEGDEEVGAGGGVARVVADNTVYKNNSGDDSEENTVCYVKKGDTGKVLQQVGDNWVKLGSISGDCGGKSGWVYNDGELRLP